jgi:hypothetical protein
MSEKPSDTLTLPLRDSVPTLLLDENLSSSSIAEFLKRIRKWTIELCTDHLPRGAPDPEVIKFCAERGWALISCDDRIRLVPENKGAVLRHRVKAFMFNKGNYLGVEYAAALIVGHGQLLKAIDTTDGYLLARVQRHGEIVVFEPRVAEATTSRAKTEQKYGKVFDRGAAANED